MISSIIKNMFYFVPTFLYLITLMSEEEQIRREIQQIKSSIEQMKAASKQSENDLKQQSELLEKEKQDLIAGVKARMQLVDMLKRDIARMAYQQALNVADTEHAKPSVKSK